MAELGFQASGAGTRVLYHYGHCLSIKALTHSPENTLWVQTQEFLGSEY